MFPEFNQSHKSALISSVLFSSLAVGTGLFGTGCGQAKKADVSEFVVPEANLYPIVTTHDTTAKNNHIQLASAEVEAVSPISNDAMLNEIAKLRTAPLEVIKEPIIGKPGEFREVTLDEEAIEKERVRRLERSVRLATQVISRTHDVAEEEKAFLSAVQFLLDARVQLVLSGKLEHAEQLSNDADQLYQRDPNSFAASESASRVVNLAQTMATRPENKDSKWLLVFSREAQKFAANFPNEVNRAALNLIVCGKLCETRDFLEEAETCYAWVEQNFAGTPFVDEVAPSLRRLRLSGEKLYDFGGPTLDKGFVSTSQLAGKPFLVVFWASNSDLFNQDLPKIQSTHEKFKGRFTVVGVNLDLEESAIRNFVQEHQIDWQNIFYADPAKRGTNHSIATYYNIKDVPQYWLVDSQGVVRRFDMKIADLEESLSQILDQSSNQQDVK